VVWWPPGSRFRFQVLIESPGFDQVGRVNFYLKKIQNGVVLEKKTKVNGLQPGYQVNLPGRPGHTGS
jgi:hypothetical protein